MRLFQYLKTSKASFYHLQKSTVCLLIILQLAAWYPFLSSAQHDARHYLKQQERIEAKWGAIQEQVNRIASPALITETWIKHRITSERHAVPTQWLVEGDAGATEWQNFFEKIEEHIALGLLSVHWHKALNGEWKGRLLFDIESPKPNREYHNWLPTTLRSRDLIRKDWRILSTMRMGDSTSALLEYKQQRHWVRQGSWLPSAGLIVDSVSFDRVTLRAKDGSDIVLTIREGYLDE